MKYSVLLGLAGAAAVSADCVGTYQSCLDAGGTVNGCQSDNAKCKNVCADSYDSCLNNGTDATVCMTTYNSCLDDFSVFATPSSSAGKDCVSTFSACHDAGEADNTCNAGNAQCKDKCSTIYGTCLTSGDADSAACMTQYNNCLDSFSVFQTPAASVGQDCVAKFDSCHANGTIDDNTCNSYNAQCKDKCSVFYGTCLSSGASDSALCMGQYNNCLDSFTPAVSVDCVSSFTTCRNNGIAANECASDSAQCKDKCSVSYSTCLSSGDADDSACLSQYSSCLVSFTTVANSTDCVTKYKTCESSDTADNTCGADNAQCKTDCSTSYSTCLSSGDPSVAAPCKQQYNSCLVSFAWTTATTASGQDCVSKFMNCDGNNATCQASNAQCKNSCSVERDTCESSGDESLDAPCLSAYDNCLVDFSAVFTGDCASEYLACDDADNVCTANAAQCKNKCSVALDTCNSAGDPALAAPCQTQYQKCLVSFTTAAAAIGEDCVGEYVTSTLPDNEASADMAQCKNKCATANDICNTSSSNTTASVLAPQCLHLYDSCLVSFSTNETTIAGQDCLTKQTVCYKSGTAQNECDADYAQCKNGCATVLDACRSSGDESLVSMCDSGYNACLDPTTNTNVTTSATVPVNSTIPVNSTGTASPSTTSGTATNSASSSATPIVLPAANATIPANATTTASGVPTSTGTVAPIVIGTPQSPEGFSVSGSVSVSGTIDVGDESISAGVSVAGGLNVDDNSVSAGVSVGAGISVTDDEACEADYA